MSRWEAFSVFAAAIVGLFWVLFHFMGSDNTRTAGRREHSGDGGGGKGLTLSGQVPTAAHSAAIGSADGYSAHAGDPTNGDWGGSDSDGGCDGVVATVGVIDVPPGADRVRGRLVVPLALALRSLRRMRRQGLLT